MNTERIDDLIINYGPAGDGVFVGRRLRSSGGDVWFVRSAEATTIVDPGTWESWAFDPSDERNPFVMRAGFSFEPELASAFDGQTEYMALGTLARTGSELRLVVKQHAMGYWRLGSIVIRSDLPELPANVVAAFSRWALVRGDGDQREAIDMDVGRATQPVH